VPLWKNIRRLATSGPLQGVVDPGPADVIMPAQAVQIIDDASRAVAPVSVPWALATTDSNTLATEFSGIEVQARGGGIWIMRILPRGNSSSQMRIWRDDAQVTTRRVASVELTVFGVPNLGALDSGVFNIRVALRPTFSAFLNQNQNASMPWTPMFVRPGERFFMTHNTSNTALAVTLLLREVPLRIRDA